MNAISGLRVYGVMDRSGFSFSISFAGIVMDFHITVTDFINYSSTSIRNYRTASRASSCMALACAITKSFAVIAECFGASYILKAAAYFPFAS